ncbi:MAG: hypothetical protein LCH30_00500 [Proteobacteria bacterium]|nr:hypothetical protein [Pseudomonadota bacterium]
MIEAALRTVSEHPDYQILRRVPLSLMNRVATESKHFMATIIDLETMGLNPKANEIIELGMLSFRLLRVLPHIQPKLAMRIFMMDSLIH